VARAGRVVYVRGWADLVICRKDASRMREMLSALESGAADGGVVECVYRFETGFGARGFDWKKCAELAGMVRSRRRRGWRRDAGTVGVYGSKTQTYENR